MQSLLLFLTSVAAVAATFFEKRKENQKDGHKNTFNLITSIVLIAAAIITYYSGCQNSKKDELADINRKTIDSLTKENAELTKIQYDTIKKILNSSKNIILSQQDLLDTSSKILERGKEILSIQKKSLDTSSMVLDNSKNLLKLQKSSQQVLNSQIDSLSAALRLSKELLRYFTGDDSLVIVWPTGSSRGEIVFHVQNSSKYPIDNIVIGFPDIAYTDSLKSIKDISDPNALTREEFDRGFKLIEFSLDGRRMKDFYVIKKPVVGRFYEIFFDVKWSNRFITYRYWVRINSNNTYTIGKQEHHDMYSGRYFILEGDNVIYR